MNVLLLEPYDTGSHRAWMQGYQAYSANRVDILSLPGRFWKWRMQGGAVTLARMFVDSGIRPDVIVASDMLNLPTFLALTRAQTADVPVAVYFHENQLTYPMGPRQRKEIHFQLGLINYTSAMVADALFFNSGYHLEAFFEELPRLLKHYPDYNELGSIAQLRDKASVLPLGVDLRRFDAFRPDENSSRSGPPLIVWNHRWEYDKNPGAFLNAVMRLAHEGIPFEVALTGENFHQNPEEFRRARDVLGARVVQYGYLDSFAAYARLLWKADVQVSTAYHDFFGVSTSEAIYCGCMPLLPRRLNYPALVPIAHHADCLYHEGQIQNRLRSYLMNPVPAPPALREHIAQFDWAVQGKRYDAALQAVAARASASGTPRDHGA